MTPAALLAGIITEHGTIPRSGASFAVASFIESQVQCSWIGGRAITIAPSTAVLECPRPWCRVMIPHHWTSTPCARFSCQEDSGLHVAGMQEPVKGDHKMIDTMSCCAKQRGGVRRESNA